MSAKRDNGKGINPKEKQDAPPSCEIGQSFTYSSFLVTLHWPAYWRTRGGCTGLGAQCTCKVLLHTGTVNRRAHLLLSSSAYSSTGWLVLCSTTLPYIFFLCFFVAVRQVRRERLLTDLHTNTQVPPTEISLRSSQRNATPDTPLAEVWPQFARALAPTGAGLRTRLTQLSSSPVCPNTVFSCVFVVAYRVKHNTQVSLRQAPLR